MEFPGRHNVVDCPVCTATSNSASPHDGEGSLHLRQHLHDTDGAAQASSPPAAPAKSPPASPPRPRRRRPGDVASPMQAGDQQLHDGASSRARTPATPPRTRRRRPRDVVAPASWSPATPPRPRRRYATRARRGCTSTPAGSASQDAAGSEEFTRKKKAAAAAAADVYLARAKRGVWLDRLRVTIALGPRYWAMEFLDWLYTMRECPRDRLRDDWTWIGVTRNAIQQNDNSCIISSALVCLEARHRLDFERRHGFNTFPFHIPDATVQFLKKECDKRGVWNQEDGGNEMAVLRVIQQVGGAFTARVPGWKFCKLQVKDWEFHYGPGMPPSEIANMICTEGPLLGALYTGTDYYAEGWEDRVYRGAPVDQEEEPTPHSVVCIAYRYHTIGAPHCVPELQIEVIDNHRPLGPVRWIAAEAFVAFFVLHVEPLDVNQLQLKLKKKPCWWRRLLSTGRGIFTWIFRR